MIYILDFTGKSHESSLIQTILDEAKENGEKHLIVTYKHKISEEVLQKYKNGEMPSFLPCSIFYIYVENTDKEFVNMDLFNWFRDELNIIAVIAETLKGD